MTPTASPLSALRPTSDPLRSHTEGHLQDLTRREVRWLPVLSSRWSFGSRDEALGAWSRMGSVGMILLTVTIHVAETTPAL